MKTLGPVPKKKITTLKELEAYFAEEIRLRREMERSLTVRKPVHP
jgi:hypothetical protein